MSTNENEPWVRELLLSVKDKRIEQLEEDFAKDERFLALSAREDEIMEEIMRQDIPGKMKSSLLRQEEIGNKILSLTQLHFYEKGFTDCLKLLRMIFKDFKL